MLPVSITISVWDERTQRMRAVLSTNAGYSNAIQRAAREIAYYTCDPEGPLYPTAEAHVEERCAKCSGTGRALKSRCKATYVVCTACNGNGYRLIGSWAFTATPEERDAWREWDTLAREGSGESRDAHCMLPTPGAVRAHLDWGNYGERAALHRVRRETATNKVAP